MAEINYSTIASLPAMFFEQADRKGDAPFLWAKKDKKFQPRSWRNSADTVLQLAAGLQELGIKAEDRVVLVSENRPEWCLADLAIMAAGAITVPGYTTNTVQDHTHILNNSGAVAAIVSTTALSRQLLPAALQAKACKTVITMEEPYETKKLRGLKLEDWAEVVANGKGAEAAIREQVDRLERTDTACIIYTSGTGGTPKGVMLSHGAIICNCMGAHDVLEEVDLDQEVFLSFLPLSHAYEHSGGQFFPISIGAEIYYAESIEKLLDNLGEVRPTVMFSVPRLFEAIRTRVQRGLKDQSNFKRKLFDKTLSLGKKRYEQNGRLGLVDNLIDQVLERLVRSKIKDRFGGRLKAFVAGGAALNYEVGLFFEALGLPLLQGYGQTEAAPVISVNRLGKVKLHTVGPPMKGVDVKIASDGEILVRGELLMQGYWCNEEATRQTLSKDGWLHTGDIGQLDEDGYLEITDRKKDIIVNAGGDNISPARVEGLVSLQDEIGQIMVYGDKKPNLVAVIIPDPEWLFGWCKEEGLSNSLESLANEERLRKVIANAVSEANQSLSNIEKVRKFIIGTEDFTTDNELMTPSMKIRRHKIREIYQGQLEGLYPKGR